MSDEYKRVAVTKFSHIDLLSKSTSDMLKAVNKAATEQTEAIILEQLGELVTRGLLVVEETKPMITMEHRNADDAGYTFRMTRAIRLVLKDQEYIERLEKEIADLTNRLLDVNNHFKEVTERLEKITVAMTKQQV
jgi:hypothetical protein